MLLPCDFEENPSCFEDTWLIKTILPTMKMLKEGGLTSAPKRDASHRKLNYECYSMRFAGVMLIKIYPKPVKRFCAVFSHQNKSKIVLESVIWAYKFQI